ncbi:MFS general substrate transporter [Venturia nashicola]|uniref:MFS general substrate transporter n=1 Tax=Venturia nashicola TaxID=86259 RepID=A0A4Z1PVI9_9PEZI|nr:MFS general substrate transporter [Venturia nashicola]TLD38942.1 MFS general substrate transporter [Venturia nashicola]
MSSSRTIWTLLILLSLQNMAIKLMNLPLNRVIELRYCQQYYLRHDQSQIGPGGSIPEELCKLDSIQQKLAWMQGMIETLHIVCDLIVTIPLSALSDKSRQRLVLGLNVAGLSLMYMFIVLVGYFGILPVGAMLIGPVFTLLGGGNCAFMSTVYGLVTQAASVETQRSSYFAYISSVSYVILLTSPSISARTMTINLWLPFWIGIIMLLVALPVIFSLKTPSPDHNATVDSLETATLLRRGSIDIKRNRLNNSHHGVFLNSKETLQHLFRQVTQRKNFRYLLSVFLIVSLASSGTPILPQYISKRYGWTFAEAGYLLTVKAVVNVTLLTVIVPNAIKALHKYTRMSGVSINVASAKASEIISVVGVILVGSSTTMGFLIFCKSSEFSLCIKFANGISAGSIRDGIRNASFHPFTGEEPANCGTGC